MAKVKRKQPVLRVFADLPKKRTATRRSAAPAKKRRVTAASSHVCRFC